MLEDLQPAAEKAGATVEMEGLGTGAVIADRAQLALVFSNLLENAIVHGLDVRPLRLSITSDDGPVMRTFAVADNGRGIEAGQRERVFRMFERLDRTRPGSGIGLTVCQRVVHAHGGEIWISGNDAGGVTIRFTIPRQPLTT